MPDADVLILHVGRATHAPRAGHAGCAGQEDSEEPRRLDQLVLQALRARDPRTPVSRGMLKRFFRESPPLLDDRAVSRTGAGALELTGRHTVTLSGWAGFLARASRLKPAERCFLPVLYEDADLLVLNKASGVPSVALSGEETSTAASAALARVPSLASLEGAKPLEPGLLHRLDTGTSGVLAFAKSAEEFTRLRALWKTSAVRKFYRATIELAEGAPPPTPCTLRDPLAHAAHAAARMVVLASSAGGAPARSYGPRASPAIRGKPLSAVTHILQVMPVSARVFELELEIETGVMHQIRAHLSSRGWPIVGDRIYNPRAARGTSEGRLMLRAWKLELPLRSGTVLQVSCLAESVS